MCRLLYMMMSSIEFNLIDICFLYLTFKFHFIIMLRSVMWSFITLKWKKEILFYHSLKIYFFHLFFYSCLECQGHVTAGYSHITCDSVVSPRCGNLVFVLRMCATHVWVSVFATSLPVRMAHVDSCYNKVSLASSSFDDSTTTLLTLCQ